MKASLVMLSAAGAAARYVPVPGGRMVPEECVHTVAAHTHIEERSDGLYVTEPQQPPRRLPDCPRLQSAPRPKLGHAMHGPAWKTWAQYKQPGSTQVTALSNDWTVPPLPANKGNQILYYWNGVEPDDSAGVVQPVLEWRSGSNWGIKSWYVGAGGTVTSDLVALQPGDKLTGSMSRFSNGTWLCTGQAEGKPPATLYYTGGAKTKFTYAYEVLEAYYVTTDASEYPASGSVAFTNTSVTFDYGKPVPKPIAWTTYSCPSGPGCAGEAQLGENTTASDDGETVTISWRTH